MLLVAAMGMALVVGSGVALAATIDCTTSPCLGTPEPENIFGSANPEEIRALAGGDFIFPGYGNDVVYGDEGNDTVLALYGNDTIYGGPDGDGSAIAASFGYSNLEGEEDSDTVYGGGGNDYVDAAANDKPGAFPTTAPVDSSYGGAGNDRIYTKDGNVDIINCGKGKRDVVIFDKGIDTGIRGCERKVAEEWIAAPSSTSRKERSGTQETYRTLNSKP
jgi:hypothetical protein